MQPLALLHHLGGKLRPVGGGQVFLQQLTCATDGGHGAFEFMGEGAHIALDVVVPLQPRAHAVHGARQVAQFAGHLGHGQGGRWGRVEFAICGALHAQRVIAQAAHVPHHPQRHAHAHGG